MTENLKKNYLIYLAKPKSAIFALPLLKKIFADLKSLWTILLWAK